VRPDRSACGKVSSSFRGELGSLAIDGGGTRTGAVKSVGASLGDGADTEDAPTRLGGSLSVDRMESMETPRIADSDEDVAEETANKPTLMPFKVI